MVFSRFFLYFVLKSWLFLSARVLQFGNLNLVVADGLVQDLHRSKVVYFPLDSQNVFLQLMLFLLSLVTAIRSIAPVGNKLAFEV